MTELSEHIKKELYAHGADLVSFGDITEINERQRSGLPIGISIAVKYPKETIKGIADHPTKEYYEQYKKLNGLLNSLATLCADELQACGYKALAQTTDYVDKRSTDYDSPLPHKTVATRAGLGWIGKSALLVTKEFGSAIRITSVLTDAPLPTKPAVNTSYCGSCMECTKACPAGAVLGKNWAVSLAREEFYNPYKCRATARKRAMQSFGIEITQCGKCIAVCPYTKKYIEKD